MIFEIPETTTETASDEVWSGVQQTGVGETVNKWRRHLQPYVGEKGRHFEHLL